MLFKKAEQDAYNGDIYAQYVLGDCYKYGHGTEKDLEKAKYWLEKSAKQKCVPAMMSLAEKIGFLEDYTEEQLIWLCTAALCGDPTAKYEYIQFLKRNGSDSKADEFHNRFIQDEEYRKYCEDKERVSEELKKYKGFLD